MQKLLINYLLILLISAAFTLLFFFGFLPAYTGNHNTVTLADFRGHQVEDVKHYIKSKGLNFRIKIDSGYDQHVQKYAVIRQKPEPLSLVKTSRTIYLTLNNGMPPKIKMPGLTDLSLSMAQKQIEQAGLKLGKIEYKPHYAHNQVLNQYYQGKLISENELVAKGTAIDLQVGQNSNLPVAMPDLSGLTLAEAKLVLNEYHLNLGSILPDSASNQLIEKQQPVAGEIITQGRLVDIWLHEKY